MTVITIRSEDAQFLRSLRQWLKKHIPSEAQTTEFSTDVEWTDAKLDAETERLVWKSILRNERNENLDSPTIQEVFYDLQR
jgi:hypothetical protein